MKTTVAERGQVTIPKALREKLGIRPGMTLDFHEENGRLVAVKLAGADPVARVFGCVKLGKSTDAVMRELRAAP